MTSDGSPYSRFQRAIKTRNLHLIRTAAAELPVVSLNDALSITLVIREREPQAFERAALRWLARWMTEWPNASLEAVGEALDAFEELQHEPHSTEAVRALRSALAG